jgi:hypothetical protein
VTNCVGSSTCTCDGDGDGDGDGLAVDAVELLRPVCPSLAVPLLVPCLPVSPRKDPYVVVVFHPRTLW